ncbi:insulinase family protein [Labilibacter sediminis]|nr:insulinase family protein [Labilibacter sediminis]
MLRRNNVPSFDLPSGLNILEQKKFNLDNGIPVHFVDGGTQDVAKIDLIFPAGIVQSSKALVASFTNNLLQEGTVYMSAFEVAEKIDFYGAYLGQSTNYHHGQVTLYSLSKYLPDVLPVIEEIIKKPAFAQHEFDVYLSKRRQDFLVDSEKVKTLAHRKSQEILFGTEHPYGRIANLSSFDQIHLEDVKAFHQSQYVSNECTIVVAGLPGEGIKDLLNKHFGGHDWGVKEYNEDPLPNPKPSKENEHLVEKENAMQSALRIVRKGVTKSHPDYLPLMILNTLFGGYFGSRLMMNLREEKGLTYGISSYMQSFLKEGVFGISTEVVAEKRPLAVQEIFKEMDKLRTELVDGEELDRVKNFMLGDLMRNLDGPFALSEAFRGLLGFDLDFSFFSKFEEIIKNISPQEILSLANKYLIKDDFYVVIAGK